MKVSIVTGTCNRLSYLKAMVASIRQQVSGLAYEFVIVDGGSTDGTLNWLINQADVYTLAQGHRLGAVKAFNAGFHQAHGKYVCNLNDDCILHGDIIQQAIQQLEADPTIGQVAFPYTTPTKPSHRYERVSPNTHTPLLYANFGVTRKELGDRLGWWSNLYTVDAGDPHLSLMIWDAGYKVAELQGTGYVQHFELYDETRRKNSDAQILYDYWKDWRGPGSQSKMATPHLVPTR